MDIQAAQQYLKTLQTLSSQLQQAETVDKRLSVAFKMQNVTAPLYVVDTHACQHIDESLRKLKYPDLAVVMAAQSTITSALDRLSQRIASHNEPHFVMHAAERYFMRPMSAMELRSAIEKNRLLDRDHAPFIHAFDAPEHVQEVFMESDMRTLTPVLSRLQFGEAEALVVFKTKVAPKLGVPYERIPSLTMCTLRSGIPVTVVRHRALGEH
jgi:hypothetical protein